MIRKKKTKPERGTVPPPESVVETIEFVSPKGNRYTIQRTTEVDGYEEPAKQKQPSVKKRKRS